MGHLVVAVTAADVAREPRIGAAATGRRHALPILAFREPCPFLAPDRRCEIYPTRPAACADFRPGSRQCQQLRRRAGLDGIDDRQDHDEHERTSPHDRIT